MGWGICFGLDENYRLFCADGCSWKASEKDYDDFHEWPSARAYVLEYYQRDAHRELDMIRDECPGTARALAQACPDYMSSAFCSYRRLSDDYKVQLHEEMLNELTQRYEQTDEQLKNATEAWRALPPAPTFKKAKTSIEKLEQSIEELKWKLEMEKATSNVKYLRRALSRLRKFIQLENSFHV